jgi:hypothetical protein
MSAPQRRLPWFLLGVILVAAPFAADFVVIVDLITLLGVDVFFLSIFYYYSGSVSAWLGPVLQTCGTSLRRRGVLAPTRPALASPSAVAQYLGHNAVVLVTPLFFVGFAMACFAVSGVAAFLRAAVVS